jgi:hypothetical protein
MLFCRVKQVHPGITLQVTHQALKAQCHESQLFLLWQKEKEQFQFQSNLIGQRTQKKKGPLLMEAAIQLRGNRRLNLWSQRQN